MCTAISYKAASHYFGRNLDLERSYGESVVVTPRRFPFVFRHAGSIDAHHAMIGMAVVSCGFPLYFDATNEEGLSAAGLNFPSFAYYRDEMEGRDNIASFELIPWLLAQCKSVSEARGLLERISITDDSFSESLSATPMHWLISDRLESVVLESVREGIRVYDDSAGILTNAPDFESHMKTLDSYAPAFRDRLGAELPGDYSSESRFVRAAFVRERIAFGGDEAECVRHFFRILSSVSVPEGCVLTEEGEYHYTRYSSCCNTDSGVYYYTTPTAEETAAADMHSCDTDGTELTVFPPLSREG